MIKNTNIYPIVSFGTDGNGNENDGNENDGNENPENDDPVATVTGTTGTTVTAGPGAPSTDALFKSANSIPNAVSNISFVLGKLIFNYYM